MQKTGTGHKPQAESPSTDKRAPRCVQLYRDVTPYVTKDGSIIRELMHPAVHGNLAQSLAHAIVPKGKRTLLHRHPNTEELYHVVGGRGRMTLGKDTYPVEPGDTVLIRPGTPHCIEAIGSTPLRILCCCSPAYSHEDTELLELAPEVIVDPPSSTKKSSGCQTSNPENFRALRKKRGLSQSQFWGTIKVTQSAASRYESGREIPKAVLTMLRLAFGTQSEATALLMDLRQGLVSDPMPTQRAIKALATGDGAKALRKSLGLNQSAFWGRVMTSQSGGARYEMGRNLPRQVVMLLQFVFGPERYAMALLSALRKESQSHGVPATDQHKPAEDQLQPA